MMHRNHMVSRTALLSAILVLTSLLAGPGAAPAVAAKSSCPVLGQFVRDGSWTWIKPPPHGDGYEGSIRGFEWYVVNPSRPNEIFGQLVSNDLANATTVFYSDDGGCRWQAKKVPQLEHLEGSHETCRDPGSAGLTNGGTLCTAAQWVSTVIPEGDRDVLYFLLNGNFGPLLLTTRDRGDSWQEQDLADLGLDESASAVHLEVAPSDAKRLYLSIALRGQYSLQSNASTLYVSSDGGESWISAYSDPLGHLDGQTVYEREAVGPSRWREVTVDPLDPDHLWVVGGNYRLWHSVDAGASWTFVDLGDGSAHAVDVSHQAGKPARVAVGGNNGSGNGLFWSDDGGSTWTFVPGPKGTEHEFCYDIVTVERKGAGGRGFLACIAGTFHYSGNPATSYSTYDVWRFDPRLGRFMGLKAPIDRNEPSSVLGLLSADRSPNPTLYVRDSGVFSDQNGWLLKFTPGK